MKPLEGKVNWSQIARDGFKREALRLLNTDNCYSEQCEDSKDTSKYDNASIHEKLDKLLQALASLQTTPTTPEAPPTPSPIKQESLVVIGTLIQGSLITSNGNFKLNNSKGDKFPNAGLAPFERKQVKITGALTEDSCLRVQHIELQPAPSGGLSSIPPPPPF